MFSLYTYFLSIIPIVLSYIVNNSIYGLERHNYFNNSVLDVSLLYFLIAFFLLLSVILFIAFLVKEFSATAWCMVFYFSSVFSLISALELDGIITKFMTGFFKHGFPSLSSSHGTMLCYWDGIVHFAIYIIISVISSEGFDENWSDIALFWCGSMLNSLIVLSFASVTGCYDTKPSFLLLILWFCVCCRTLRTVLNDPKLNESVGSDFRFSRKSRWLFIAAHFLAVLLELYRALAALDAHVPSVRFYAEHFEPYLREPGKFALGQMMVFLFYFIPYHLFSILNLFDNSLSRHFSALSTVFAGAAAQAQVCFLGASLHSRTPYVLRVSREGSSQAVFWLVNSFLLLLPISFAVYVSHQQPAPPVRATNGDVHHEK